MLDKMPLVQGCGTYRRGLPYQPRLDTAGARGYCKFNSDHDVAGRVLREGKTRADCSSQLGPSEELDQVVYLAGWFGARCIGVISNPRLGCFT